MDIYVGNLSYIVTEDDLKNLFSKFGPVKRVKITIDSETGQSQHWGFVAMENEADGEKAIKGLNLKDFRGKRIKVNRHRSGPAPFTKPKFGQWIPK